MPTKCKLCPEPRWFGTKRGLNVHKAFTHERKHRKYKTVKPVQPQKAFGGEILDDVLTEYKGNASLRVSMLDGSLVTTIPVTVQLEFGS